MDYRLNRDLACAACGYNLRGLWTTGDCPECGVAIRRTLGGEALEWLDRPWVRRLRAGCLLILASQVLLIVAAAWGLRPGGEPVWLSRAALPALAGCAAGAWLVTSYAVGPNQDALYRRNRRFARVTSVAPLVATLLPAAGLWVGLLWPPCILFTFLCLGDLARRAHRAGVARAADTAAWSLPLGMWFSTGLLLLMYFTGKFGPAISVVVCGIPLLLAAYLVALFVLVRFLFIAGGGESVAAGV